MKTQKKDETKRNSNDTQNKEVNRISPKFISIKDSAPINVPNTGDPVAILPWCC